MNVISRKAAKMAGEKYYFTGSPCKRGHIDRRFVSSFGCMSCAREKAKEEWDAQSSEKREARRDYARKRWQDPEFRERQRNYPSAREYRKRFKKDNPEYFREHYAKNRERRKRQANEWYHANAERACEARKEYIAKNRDKARVWGRKSANTRRAITKRVFIEAVDPRTVFDRDKGICGICREQVDPMSKWEVDHVIPISKGGLHCYANVQLAHRKCNRSKAAKVA